MTRTKLTPKKLRAILLGQAPKRAPRTAVQKQRDLNRALYGVK